MDIIMISQGMNVLPIVGLIHELVPQSLDAWSFGERGAWIVQVIAALGQSD